MAARFRVGFDVADAEGSTPEAGLLLGLDGNYYGVTAGDGPNSLGTVFRVTPAGSLTVLDAFKTGVQGIYANTTLVQDRAGNLYGTAPNGGSDAGSDGEGTVFEVSAAGGFTALYTFHTAPDADGAFPAGGLIFTPNGLLAGTTEYGDDSKGDGPDAAAHVGIVRGGVRQVADEACVVWPTARAKYFQDQGISAAILAQYFY